MHYSYTSPTISPYPAIVSPSFKCIVNKEELHQKWGYDTSLCDQQNTPSSDTSNSLNRNQRNSSLINNKEALELNDFNENLCQPIHHKRPPSIPIIHRHPPQMLKDARVLNQIAELVTSPSSLSLNSLSLSRYLNEDKQSHYEKSVITRFRLR